METEIPAEYHKTYPDPTRPVLPSMKRKINLGWAIFIGFNILFPIAFVITYFWVKNS